MKKCFVLKASNLHANILLTQNINSCVTLYIYRGSEPHLCAFICNIELHKYYVEHFHLPEARVTQKMFQTISCHFSDKFLIARFLYLSINLSNKRLVLWPIDHRNRPWSNPNRWHYCKDKNIMTTDHLNMGVETTPETSLTLNIPQTLDNVWHYIRIMNHPLSRNFMKLFVSFQSCLLSKPFPFS